MANELSLKYFKRDLATGVSRINEDKKGEIAEIEKLYSEKISLFCDSKYRDASGVLLGDLKNSNKLLRDRTFYVENKNGFEEAVEVSERLRGLSPENQEYFLNKMNLGKEVLNLIPYVMVNSNLDENAKVSSYCFNSEKSLYLLAPVREGKNISALEESLAERLNSVFGLGEIAVGLSGIVDRKKGVRAKKESLQFVSESEYVRNFLLYSLTPKNGRLKDFRISLCDKLSDKNIQPNFFDEANLRHEVVRLPGGVLREFKKGYEKSESPIIVSDASEEGVDKENIQNYSTDDLKEDAFVRLCEYGSQALNTYEVGRVLGMGATGINSRLNRSDRLTFDFKDGRKNMFYPGTIAEFIENNIPKSNSSNKALRWHKK